MSEQRWAMVVLVAFLILATIYSIVTPIFEASDELWHYPVVQYIASGHGLPVQTPTDRPGLWKQQASQPPLYYVLAALLTSWIDTSDLRATLRWNIHGAVGQVTPDGNINMVVHDPAREAWPWRGTVLAVHIARLLSVVLGTATVYLTYRLGKEAFPDRTEIALGAVALVAFMPMFTFISGSVNNDNLVTPLCALALLIMIRQSKLALDDERRLMRGYGVLGIVIGLAILSKVNGAALLALAALTGAWVAWKRRLDWRHLFAAGMAIGLPVLALTGWWFWRNLQLYGDLLGFKLFTPYFTRPVPADLAQIWSERTSFLYGYWGNFGGLNLPIPAWAFNVFNALLLLAVAGWGARLFFASPFSPIHEVQPRGAANSSPRDPAQFARFLIVLWAIIVFVGWLSWTRTTWSSQGRLVFYALPAYSLLIVAGLAGLVPRRFAPLALGVLSLALLLFAAALPFAVIAPAYARPPQLTDSQRASIPNHADVTFGDALVLLGYDAPSVSIKPGDSIRITLYWQALKPTGRDYKVFVHLLDENDVEVQDKGPALPGRGNLPPTTLMPGRTWAETWDVPIRSTAYAPTRLIWEVGLCDACDANDPRLPATSRDGRALGSSIRFGQVTLIRPSDSPFNPVSHNFGDQIELTGYDLARRAAGPGETVNLTLYWRAVHAPSRDYTVFAHVLQPPQTKWAGFDKQPAPPTSQWKPGQIVSDTYPLKFDPNTPSGVYEIEIGVYYFTGASNFERLKILTRDGRQQQDFVLLSKVRVTR